MKLRLILAPEEVQEFIAVDTSEDNEVDNVELKFELMWKNPCASNGKWLLTLELNGQYTEDPSNSHIQKFTFEDTTENLNVSKDLRYSYNYNATIISSNEAGDGGSKTIAFTTKPNCKLDSFITKQLCNKICVHFRSWRNRNKKCKLQQPGHDNRVGRTRTVGGESIIRTKY